MRPWDDPGVKLAETTTAHLTARLSEAQRASRVASTTAGLLRNGELVWSAAAGHIDGSLSGENATTATQYRIGSITKSFTAVLVMQLVADGLVDLDDPVDRHLPELGPALAPARVGELLNHGSGLYAETLGDWWERSAGRTWEELLPSIRRAHRPGSRFHYSNVGFAVAGRLVTKVLDVDRDGGWWSVIQDRILTPLGMSATTYSPSAAAAPGLAVHPHADLLHDEPATDTGAMAPAGQLWSTIGDLAVFARFLAYGDRAVLPDDLRTAMHVPSLVSDVPGESWSRAYGLGLDVINRDGTRYVGHGGSMPGFQSVLRVDPETGDGVILLVNDTAGIDLDAIGLLESSRQLEPAPPRPWQVADPDDAALTHELLPLTGTWYWGTRAHLLTLGPSGSVRLEPVHGGRGSRFMAIGSGEWRGLDDYFAGEILAVRHAADGAPYLDLASFRLTRTPYDPKADIPGGVGRGWNPPADLHTRG